MDLYNIQYTVLVQFILIYVGERVGERRLDSNCSIIMCTFNGKTKQRTSNFYLLSILMASLAQCLADTLNPDATTRIKAELRLSELFLDPSASFVNRDASRV